MKVTIETENYAVINVPGGNEGKGSWEQAVGGMLKICEDLREQGYRPLHYLPRISAWVCEKPKKFQKVA